MKKQLRLLVPIILLLALSDARAVPFTPTFSDYSFPGSQYTVDAPANTFFSTNYGITINNAYLYRDGRDTFDGIGISCGEVSEIGSTQTGRIDFLDTTNYVNLDYWVISGNTAVYSVLDAANNVLGSFNATGEINASYLFTFDNIAALTWTSRGGYGQVSGLSYDYDGVTDGRNNDVGRVPDIGSTFAMLGLALLGLAGFARKHS